jgi:hypothetical protein
LLKFQLLSGWVQVSRVNAADSPTRPKSLANKGKKKDFPNVADFSNCVLVLTYQAKRA